MSKIRWLASAIIVALAADAGAKTIDVFPGPGTPLQDAIAAAAPKDHLRVHQGTYTESIVIDRPLEIFSKEGAVIDAGCMVPTAVTIASDGVRLANFAVRGGTFTLVEVGADDKVDLFGVNGAPDCITTQYGIRAVGVKRLSIRYAGFEQYDTTNSGLGCHLPLTPFEHLFDDAAIYVTGTAPGAKVRIVDTFMCVVSTAIRLENIVRVAKAPPPVLLQRNSVPFTHNGILLQNVHGATVQTSSLGGFRTFGSGPGDVGIDLDASSSDNVLAENSVMDFTTDIVDDGTSNCWRLTKYSTGTLPSGGCP